MLQLGAGRERPVGSSSSPGGCRTSATCRCDPAGGSPTPCARRAATSRCSDVDAGLLAGCASDRSPTWSGRSCTARPARTAPCATSLDCSASAYVGAGAAACRMALTSRSPKTVVARAGLRDARLRDAAAQSLFRELGARPRCSTRSSGGSGCRSSSSRPAAAPRSASPLVADADAPAARDGRLLRVRRHRAGRARGQRHRGRGVSVVDTGDGPCALPAVEIVTADGPYDYDARYNAGRHRVLRPGPAVPDAAAARSPTSPSPRTSALGLRDLSRTDLIVDRPARARPWFLEVNVAPGMTETSLLPQAAEAAGLSTCGSLYRAHRRRRSGTRSLTCRRTVCSATAFSRPNRA